MVEMIDGGVTTPQGFKAAGVHSGVKYRSLDLGLLYSEVPASAFAGFTSNNVKAAPVQVMMKENSPTLSAVVVNSGNANALTGRRGIEDAISMKQAVANELSLDPVQVGVMSTGLIGRFMDMHKIRYGISRAAKELSVGREADNLLAEAIMTTDTIKKECAARVRLRDGTLVYIGAISKGSGMISPHMKVLHGTTLSLVTTDARLSPAFREKWQSILDDSMNMVSVDGDQSTNDTALLLANGAASSVALSPKHPDWPAFAAALDAIALALAKEMVRDGEGADKFVTLTVRGAASALDAECAARAVANSFLVKTSWVGTYPNWGRIMDALGYSAARVKEEKVEIFYDGLRAVCNGVRAEAPEAKLSAILAKPEFSITVDLHLGRGSAVVYTCDCTEEYVRINMD